MDEYVNTDVGIYHIEYLCDDRYDDGHKLYHVKCRYCDYESDMKLSNIKQPKICKHTSRTGRIIDFKFLWSSKRLGEIYKGILDRCYNESNKSYKWYGAKGIDMCQEWLDDPKTFESWALNNGYANNLTIDRIDSSKNYCPENCRWISISDNSSRAGNVTWITVEGETLTGRQWSEKLRIGINTINTIIRNYGLEKTKLLISAMLKEPPSTKCRKPCQTWFSVYGIQI